MSPTDSQKPIDFRWLINRWDTAADFSRDIGVPEELGRQMKRRNSVSIEHWDAIILAARRRGILTPDRKLVTTEFLHQLYVAKDRGAKKNDHDLCAA